MYIMDHNESLFWKVYRNIYLNKQIYYQLNTMEIYFQDYKKYKVDNRIKHEHINSLEWMVENRQLVLLKNKLLNNEFVDISRKGVRALTKLIKYNYQENKGDEEPTLLFRLLMKLKRNEMNRNDLLEFVFLYKNFRLLEILLEIGEIDSKFYPLLSCSLKNQCPPKVVHLILNSKANLNDKDLVTESVLENSIPRIVDYNNMEYQETILPFILNSDNPKLYKEPFKKENSTQSYYSKKFQDLNHIFNVQSNQLRNLFLDKDYFINSYKNELEFDKCLNYLIHAKEFKTKLLNVDLILLYFKIYYKCICSDSNSIPNSIQERINKIKSLSKNTEKELLELLIKITKNNQLYVAYYHTYYELVQDDKIDLKGIDLNHVKLCQNVTNILGRFKTSDYNVANDETKNEIIEYIKSFANEFNFKKLRKNKLIVNVIRDTIFNIMDSKEWYEKAIESIPSEKRKKFDLPLEWNKLLKQMMIEPMKSEPLLVDDKEFIDWLSSKCIKHRNSGITLNVKSEYYSKRRKHLVQFSSIELEHYSILKLEIGTVNSIIEPIKWSQISNNPLLKLFKECNIEIDSIIDESYQRKCNQNVVRLFKCLNQQHIGIRSIKNIEISSTESCEEFKYGSYEFKPILLKHFINQVLNNDKINGSAALSNFNSLDIDYVNFSSELVELLFKSIVEYDLVTSKFIINTLGGDISKISEQFTNLWNDRMKTNSMERGASYGNVLRDLLIKNHDICTIKDIEIEKVVVYVKFWIGFISTSTSALSTLLNQIIINHLYKKLIQVQGISIQQVIEIKELILNNIHGYNNIEFEYNLLFHTFYYFNIKSPKIIKYLMGIPGLFSNLNRGEYDCNHGGNNQKEDKLRGLYNLNIFSFDYLFGNSSIGCNYGGASFETIIKNLIIYFNECHLKEIKCNASHHHYDINSIPIMKYRVLSYFLDIKRIDLFLEEMDTIKPNILKDEEFTKPPLRTIDSNYDFLANKLCKLLPNGHYGLEIVKRLIDLVNVLNGKENHIGVFNDALISHRKDIISFLINNYNITKVTTYSNQFYQILEYLYINHPNVEVIANGIINLPFIKSDAFYEIFSKYPKKFGITDYDLNQALKCNDTILLNYFHSLGYVDKDEINNTYISKNGTKRKVLF